MAREANHQQELMWGGFGARKFMDIDMSQNVRQNGDSKM